MDHGYKLSLRYLIALTGLWLHAGVVIAGNFSDECQDALVMETYKSFQRDRRDYRLADQVTKDQFEKITGNGSLGVSIYGFSGEGGYKDYKDKVAREASSHKESLTTDEVRNVLWTHLDPKASEAYGKCIEAVANQGGLTLFVKSANEKEVTLWLRWQPRSVETWLWSSVEPTKIKLTWSGNPITLDPLPTNLSEGKGIPVTLTRGRERMTVGVRSGGEGSAVTVTPLPPPPPPVLPSPVIFSSKKAWRDATSETFDFDTKESESAEGVRPTPWTFVVPQAGKIHISALFTSEGVPVTYLSCAIKQLRPQEIDVAKRQCFGHPTIVECPVDADIDVSKGDQFRVGFGKAGSTNGNPVTPVRGRVTVDYLQ